MSFTDLQDFQVFCFRKFWIFQWKFLGVLEKFFREFPLYTEGLSMELQECEGKSLKSFLDTDEKWR